MIMVYKCPPEYVEFLRGVVGTEGSRLNMDVKDVDGNTVISQVAWEMEEFQWLKEEYPNDLQNFELIPYKPIQVPFNR